MKLVKFYIVSPFGTKLALHRVSKDLLIEGKGMCLKINVSVYLVWYFNKTKGEKE